MQWRREHDLSDKSHTIDPETVPGDLDYAPDWSASSDAIEELTRRFQKTKRKRMVLVGDAGAGKTTLAIQIMLHLLENRSASDPVPVLLPIAGWDTKQFRQLPEWLQEQLPKFYPLLRSSKFARALRPLVSGGHILPVLDGFDELPSSARAGAVVALRFLDKDQQLILTSRTAAFSDAADATRTRINSGVVLRAQPLSPSAAADYLEAHLHQPGSAWRQVLHVLRTVPRDDTGARWAALIELTSTPLGLWLLRSVYGTSGADGSELTDVHLSSPVALRQHLYDALIPAVIDARRTSSDPAEHFLPRRDRDPIDTRRYLGYLANLLTEPRNSAGIPRTHDFAWWRLASAAGCLTSTLRNWVAILTALAATAALAVPAALLVSPGVGVLGGLIFGVATGLGAGAAVFQTEVSEPGHIRQRLRGDSRSLVRAILTAGDERVSAPSFERVLRALAVVLLVAGPLIYIKAFHLLYVLFGLLVIFLVTHGLTAGVTHWLEVPNPDDRPNSPAMHLAADRKLAMVRMLVFGSVYGVAVLIAISCLKGIVPGIFFGAAAGLAAALSSGILAGKHRAWLAYSISLARLSRRGVLPADLMLFLDDAHRLGLLRAVGPLYQFRHADLQDYLALLYKSGTSCRSSIAHESRGR